MTPPPLPKKTITAACWLSMILLGAGVAVPATMLTAIVADLGLTRIESGTFLSAAFWGLAAGMIACGAVADRIGFRPLLVAGGLLSLGGPLLVASASGVHVLVLGAAITGVGAGLFDALLTPVICALYPHDRGRMNNLLHAFFPIGVVLTALAVVLLVHCGWTWAAIYRLLALCSLPCAVSFAIVPLPQQTHASGERAPLRSFGATGVFVGVFLAMVFAGMSEIGPSQWLPAFIEDARGSTRSAGALGLVLFATTMAVGRLGISAMIRRFGTRGVLRAGALLSAVSLGMASLPLGAGFTLVWLVILGLGVSGLWPTMLAFAGDRYPRAGASMYAVLASAGALGCAVGPLVIGIVAQYSDLDMAMRVLTGAPVGLFFILRSIEGRR